MESQPPPEPMSRDWDQVDDVAAQFDEALRRSERPSIRAELERVQPEDRSRLLAELVELEIAHRRRAGEDANLADYAPVMSELSSTTPSDRVESPSPNDEATTPELIGRYTIVATLDQGGQARTFRALHPGFQNTVVIKLAHRPADPRMVDRITHEGRLLASLPPNRHLVRVYDVDLYEGRVFLVLEDVPGSTLEQYAKDRPLDAQWSARTVAAIARAVHLAHDQGITHLDLNPRNVLIDREGQPRVIDFGMAWSSPWWSKGEAPEHIGGTPRYLSPEQALGQSERIGRATDVFGLGGILYFLLTNMPLYRGKNILATLQQAREADFDRKLLDRPAIPPRLRAICLKALAKETKDRYLTAADFAEALEQFLAPATWTYRAMLACLFLLSFGLAWGLQTYRREERPAIQRTGKPALEIRIWRPEAPFQPLLQALPVRSGDEVQVRCRVPKGQAVSMYFVNTMGKIRLLKRYPAADVDREIFYPDMDETQRIVGEPGMEMFLALGGADGLAPEDLQTLWDGEAKGPAWPPLSQRTVVRLSADGVDFEGDRNRELGETRDRADTQEQIRKRLDELRKRLNRKYVFFEGLAFTREPGP